MALAFNAKFHGKCANGHQVDPGDYIAYNDDNILLCIKCPEFETRTTPKGTKEGSLKFCSECNMEIAMSGIHDCW